MRTYIYGKFSPDTVPHNESNEFHTLSLFLGAYLSYCETPEIYADFKDYAKVNNLIYKENQTIHYWGYVNKAHAFVRDRVNKEASPYSKKYVSKRQIRKLGFSGFASRRMYPLNGDTIQKEMFIFVFGQEQLTQVREIFFDYVSQKWGIEHPLRTYLFKNGGGNAVDNAFRMFISFQYELLSLSSQGQRIIRELSGNPTYKTIQSELEKRG